MSKDKTLLNCLPKWSKSTLDKISGYYQFMSQKNMLILK